MTGTTDRTSTSTPTPTPGSRAGATTAAAAHADELIASMMERRHIPGLSVAIVSDTGPLHLNEYGRADLARRAPVTRDTSFLWFSLTKIVTATAALQLADAGRLDLAAPVTDYVELASKRHATAVPVVGQLLNHTAGFANPLPTRWVRAATEPPVDPRAFLAQQLRKHGKPKHPIGDGAHYSNLGYLVLGEVIAQAAQQPFADYVTEAILVPAGMTSTGFTHRRPGAAATPYVRMHRPGGPLLNVVFPHDLIGRRTGAHIALEPFYVDGASYGGLVGTAADAGRFASLHLADGTIDGRQILLPTTARQMRVIDTRGARDFGQGWFRAADHRALHPTYVEHLGAGGGFYNAMRLYPELNLGIVTMANTTSSYPHHELFSQLAELEWS